jgi:hypothetical protein
MGIFDIFTGAPGKEAAAQNADAWRGFETKGLGYLDTALPKSEAALGSSKATLAGLGAKYGAGSSLYLDALGANGPEGAARATGAFQAGPGYQWNVDQALDQTARAGAASGMLMSGNTLTGLQDRAGNLANQEYGNWLNNLKATISPEVSGVTGAAGSDAALAGLYQTDAGNRIGLGRTATTGVTDATTQGANAEMAGSGNLWNFGLNLAKLGTGAAGRFG